MIEYAGETFGQWLRRKRKEKGFTQESLAVAAGNICTSAYISSLEREQEVGKSGRPTRPDVAIVDALAFEEARMLAVCIPPREHLRPLIIATRDTGLRKSALLSLTWRDIDLEGGRLLIPRGNRYNRRPKVIVVTGRLKAELERMSASSDPDAPVFGCVKDFKRSYRTACRLAGIEGLRFNDWRHGFATEVR